MSINMQTTTHSNNIVESLWRVGVAGINGEYTVRKALQEDEIGSIDHLIVVGKAAESMYQGATSYLSEQTRVLLITKYGHISGLTRLPGEIQVIESAHPVPDKNSLLAGKQLLAFIESIRDTESLVMLVSGGASALAEHLPANIGLDELQDVTQNLIADGHSIDQINQFRCRLSNIKGGRLFQNFKGKSVNTYAISDVPDDDIRVIGSGIGSNQSIIQEDMPLPESIRSILDKAGMTEIPPATASGFSYRGRVIASNFLARKAIADYAAQQGYRVVVNRNQLSQDITQAAKTITDELVQKEKGVYIWGGEPTINLPDNPGFGGRNQHLALLVARAISGVDNITVIVAGTDGTDGPTPCAGAIVDGGTYSRDAEQALEDADSGTFLRQRGALYNCGPTGTNVMDIAIGLKI